MSAKQTYYRLFLYLCGFFLLWEWLRPLDEITNTGEMHYFIIFIAISLLLNYIAVALWIRHSLKAILIITFLYKIFSIEQVGIFSWLNLFSKDVIVNVRSLFTGKINDLSDLFLTLLFFVLLWIMTYLLHYWLIVSKRIFTFYIMSVIYIGILDTFTKYDGKWAIVRIVGIGFIILGLLFFQRLLEKEQVGNRHALLSKWMIPLTVMIVASMLVGFTIPKSGPIWPDPVPFLQSSADNVMPRENEMSRIGYGADDSRLGGPFIGDGRVVFEVSTPTRQYWRVETKDVYTGKGWTTSMKSDPQGEHFSGDEFPLVYSESTDEPTRHAYLDIKIPYPHIVMPYGFHTVIGNEDGHFKFDRSLNKILSYDAKNKSMMLEQYELEYKRAAYSLSEMRGTKGLPDEQLYNDVVEQYTQLPEGLPERIIDLSYELTSEHDNWFDKAKSIERYFQIDEFYYDQRDVAIPEKDEDYVDQFLFETRRGYCDNFSTSMVVLLRAAGIPARWAKGYASGQYTGQVEDGNRLFQVTNNEAHSWVEVFFPTQGWVPFEPTRGFSNLTSYIYDENDDSDAVRSPNIQQSEPILPEIEDKPEAEDTKKEEIKSNDSDVSKFQTFIANHEIKLILIFIFVVVISVWLYWIRSKWIPYMLLLIYHRKTGEEAFINAYRALLKQLERFGLKRESGQTLREFASYVDEHLGIKDMSILTQTYERIIYRAESTQSDWNQERKLWKNILKRTTS